MLLVEQNVLDLSRIEQESDQVPAERQVEFGWGEVNEAAIGLESPLSEQAEVGIDTAVMGDVALQRAPTERADVADDEGVGLGVNRRQPRTHVLDDLHHLRHAIGADRIEGLHNAGSVLEVGPTGTVRESHFRGDGEKVGGHGVLST